MKEVVEILKPIKIEASLTSNTNITINLNINAKKQLFKERIYNEKI